MMLYVVMVSAFRPLMEKRESEYSSKLKQKAVQAQACPVGRQYSPQSIVTV